jgi:hypothetical protein
MIIRRRTNKFSDGALSPFMPAGNPELRASHAQEYSAHCLGEIAKHLERFAAAAEKLDRTLGEVLSTMKHHEGLGAKSVDRVR